MQPMSESEMANNVNPNLIRDGIKSSYEYHQALVSLVSTSKQNFILMGELLYRLKSDDNYLDAVGEGIDTWIDYIKQPEIGLSIGEANRLVQIYEHFVERLGYRKEDIAEIPVKNLHYLLPIVKGMDDTEEVMELLNEALHLSQRDFKERVYEIKHEDEERTYSYIVMKKCDQTSTLSRVYDIDSYDIIEAFRGVIGDEQI